MSEPIQFTKRQLQFLREVLGEGFHTGFRKATGHEDSIKIWGLISNLPDDEYKAIIDFVVDGLEVMAGCRHMP